MRRFVFVPIFGDVANVGDPDGWLKVPHVKAWGFLDDKAFTPIHADPPLQSAQLHEPFDLFDQETKAMIDVPEDSTDLPEQVCVALAKMALCPELVEAN